MWIFDKIGDMLENMKIRAGSKAPLTEFSYNYGGNMCGNSHSETVMPYDAEHARISVSHADWHYENPKVNEYLVDISIMKRLEEVFRRYHMERWNGKKFTKLFVCDGETYGYGFNFGKNYLGFSSQIFPGRFYDKLKNFHDIIEEYIKNGQPLPHLEPERIEEKNSYSHYKPEDGRISTEVFKYCEGMLYYRILNGTDEKYEYERNIKIFREEEKEPVFTAEKKYKGNVYQHSSDEEYIKIPEQLPAGTYRLEIDKISCSFKIVSPGL